MFNALNDIANSDIEKTDKNTLAKIIIQSFKKGIIEDIADICININKSWNGNSKIEIIELLPDTYKNEKEVLYDILLADKENDNKLLPLLKKLDINAKQILKIIDTFQFHNNKNDLINEESENSEFIEFLNNIDREDLKELFDANNYFSYNSKNKRNARRNME